MSEATQRPWRIETGYEGSGPWDRITIEAGDAGSSFVVATVNKLNGKTNAELIVHAVNNIDRLAAERDGLRKAADMAQRRLEDFADQANAGNVHYSARELKRKIWAAFADYAALAVSDADGDRG